MQHKRHILKPRPDYPVTPFDTAQEAWFWFVRCQKMRDAGARFQEGMTQAARPCEPDDLDRAVVTLARDGRIGKAHLSVLRRFGVAERPPDPRCREEEYAARLWDDALDGLTTVLRHKGIIRMPEDTGPSEIGAPGFDGDRFHEAVSIDGGATNRTDRPKRREREVS